MGVGRIAVDRIRRRLLDVALLGGTAGGVALRKARKTRRKTETPIPNRRRRVGSLLGTLGRPALAVSVLLLIVYLSLAPGVLQQIEDDFQQKMAFARDPETYWAEVEQAVQSVRSDAQVMATLARPPRPRHRRRRFRMARNDETCPTCETLRHSLLTHCERCGTEKVAT